MRIIPRVRNWVLTIKKEGEELPTYLRFKTEKEALRESINQCGPGVTIDTTVIEYPIIPIIERIHDENLLKIDKNLKYMIKTKGSTDLAHSLSEAILIWFWLVTPHLTFIYWRIRKRIKKEKEEEE